MRLPVVLVVFLVGCAGSRSAPPIDREPVVRATEALPADATHKAETAPKPETTPTSAAHSDKDVSKDAARDSVTDAKKEPAKASGEDACPAGMKLVDLATDARNVGGSGRLGGH